MTEPTLCDITPEQAKAWASTRSAMVWTAPAFTHVFYSMMAKVGNEHVAMFTKEVPIAATDGTHILINPDTFFPLSLSERVFVVCHEIAHGIFAHMEMMHRCKSQGKVSYPDGKTLSYDHETMNKAMDYVINDMLIESKIGTYNPSWLHDTTIATHMEGVLTAYRRIHQDDGGKSGKSGQSGFDQHQAPGQSSGTDPQSAAAARNDVAWKTAVAGAMASARAQGKLPAAMERMFNEVLEPKVDWTDRVISFFARKPGGGTYDWRKPDRRLITRNIIAPGRSGFGCGPVVVAIDTSGSIGDGIISRFFGEMAGILEDVRPASIHIMFCDAHVHRVDEVSDTGDLMAVRQKKAPGGGGTAFGPVFDKIDDLDIQCDALIYLTDGYGSFPAHSPSYPVIWGDITGNSGKRYPFGEVIDIPIK